MNWKRRAPKVEGYYWFLPGCDLSFGELLEQRDATVMHRDRDGDWTFVGNDMTFRSSELNGRWWPEALTPPTAT